MRDGDPLRDAVINVCFDVRIELDRAYGLANRRTKQLISYMYSLHDCKDRSERIEVVFRIAELLNAVHDEHKRWPVTAPAPHGRDFQPSVFRPLSSRKAANAI